MLRNDIDKIRFKTRQFVSQRGYGLSNLYSSSLAGKGTISKPVRAVAYGSFGAMIVSQLAFGTQKWMLNMGMRASRVYGDTPSFSGQYGFRNTYSPLGAGVSGLRFSFRGKRIG